MTIDEMKKDFIKNLSELEDDARRLMPIIKEAYTDAEKVTDEETARAFVEKYCEKFESGFKHIEVFG